MEVDIEMVVDDEDDEVQNENDLEILEGNANDEIAPSDTMKWLIVMMTLMIRLTRTHMKIIFNRCNAIFHLFCICF
jgi:hypothetical protein